MSANINLLYCSLLSSKNNPELTFENVCNCCVTGPKVSCKGLITVLVNLDILAGHTLRDGILPEEFSLVNFLVNFLHKRFFYLSPVVTEPALAGIN